ncbi:MAG: hypothetical protein WC569_01850 [Candidatus Omnitrophota bacterium]
MARFKKVFSLILVIIFLYQNLVFCVPDKSSILRIPVGLSKERTEAVLNSTKEISRTDPLNFDPNHFLFLIKTMVRLKYEEDSTYRRIEEYEIASVSCITQNHLAAVFGIGYILDVPDENILARYTCEVQSGFNKRRDGIAAIIKDVDKKFSGNKRSTLKEVLDSGLPQEYNEIIVDMGKVKVAGIFYRPEKLQGIAEEVFKSLLKEAKERAIPLIELGSDLSSKIIYNPQNSVENQLSFVKMGQAPVSGNSFGEIVVEKSLSDIPDKSYRFPALRDKLCPVKSQVNL